MEVWSGGVCVAWWGGGGSSVFGWMVLFVFMLQLISFLFSSIVQSLTMLTCKKDYLNIL